MKLCMRHCIHKSIPDAKFQADSSSSFGDMTSQNFPRKKWGTSHRIRLFTPGNGFNFKQNEFLCPESFFSTQNWPPMSISSISKERKIFSFSKFLWRLDEKRAAATPWLINFAKIWSERVLRIKTKSHQVWASSNKRFLIGSCKFGHPGLWAPPPGLIGLKKAHNSRDEIIPLNFVRFSLPTHENR